jgi:hypothetical protein
VTIQSYLQGINNLGVPRILIGSTRLKGKNFKKEGIPAKEEPSDTAEEP